MAASTPVRSHKQIVFEGVPGVGKSTTSEIFAQTLKRIIEENQLNAILALNGKDISVGKTEAHMEETGAEFIRKRYCKDIRNNHLGFSLSVPNTFVNFEIQTKTIDFPHSFRIDAPTLIHVMERNSATACGIFQYVTWQHLREMEGSSKPSPSDSWEDMSNFKSSLLPIVQHLQTSTFNVAQSVIIFLDPDTPELAYERMRQRGREYEVDGLEMEYMALLWHAQKAFCELEPQKSEFRDKVTSFSSYYPSGTNIIRIPVTKTTTTDDIITSILEKPEFQAFLTN